MPRDGRRAARRARRVAGAWADGAVSEVVVVSSWACAVTLGARSDVVLAGDLGVEERGRLTPHGKAGDGELGGGCGVGRHVVVLVSLRNVIQQPAAVGEGAGMRLRVAS